MRNYVDDGALTGMSRDYRELHLLLCGGVEALAQATALAKLRGLDTAVVAETTASMALAQAARALVVLIHERRRFFDNGGNHALGIH